MEYEYDEIPRISYDKLLNHAINCEKVDVIEYLLERGANINKITNEHFLKAIRKDNLELIEFYSKLTKKNGKLYFKNDLLKKAFLLAAKLGKLDIIILLKETGINFDSELKKAINKAKKSNFMHVAEYLKKIKN